MINTRAAAGPKHLLHIWCGYKTAVHQYDTSMICHLQQADTVAIDAWKKLRQHIQLLKKKEHQCTLQLAHEKKMTEIISQLLH